MNEPTILTTVIPDLQTIPLDEVPSTHADRALPPAQRTRGTAFNSSI